MRNNPFLSSRQLWTLYIGIGVIYILGTMVPLMQNDSAQHASMAMRMTLTGDYLNLFKGENAYLDKPHMHFWLSALAMEVFGVNHIAYRLPAIISLAIGAVATKRLFDVLYPQHQLGQVASLVFLCSQSIILSGHDVRTDAVLTGFVILSVYLFVEFLQRGKWYYGFVAGLSAAISFDAKGLMPVVIIGIAVLSYLIYSGKWSIFFSKRMIYIVSGFALGIAPVLYAYYSQFGAKGIEFILIGQSLGRLDGSDFGSTHSDPFFFFHTLLWVFLPLSVPLYFAVYFRTAELVRSRFSMIDSREVLTIGSFWGVMLLFSLSSFKLPHYLNGLLPLLSILVVAYLSEEKTKGILKFLKGIQIFVVIIALLLVLVLLLAFTGVVSWFLLILVALSFLLVAIGLRDSKGEAGKILWIALIGSVSLNMFLNSHFYPILTQYQGSYTLAQWVNRKEMSKDNIVMLEGSESWAFDFYTSRNTPRISPESLEAGQWVVLHESSLLNLKRSYKIIRAENDFRITRLSAKFINPQRRAEQLSKMIIVEIL